MSYKEACLKRIEDHGECLNKSLLTERGIAEEARQDLATLHYVLETLNVARIDCSPDIMKFYDDLQNQVEFKLQETWKFEKNSKFFKFWYRTGCICPKMDNDDAYPTGYYVMVGDCPVHGDNVNE